MTVWTFLLDPYLFHKAAEPLGKIRSDKLQEL